MKERREPRFGPGGFSLVSVLGLTFLMNQYDMALLGLALPQIQAELGIAEGSTGNFLAAVRLGAIAALGFALAADHTGRRRLLALTIAGFALTTTLSAFAPDARTFGALQFLARACIAAEEVIAIVFVAEALPAAVRGRAFGWLAIFGAAGHGLAAIAYGFVEHLPFGWRALYLLGALPLPLLWWMRRNLAESPRFTRERASQGAPSVRAKLAALFRTRRGASLALLVAMAGFGASSGAALAFVSKTLQEVHGYSPPDVTRLVIGGGTLALVAYPLAGALSDRLGRRPVLLGALALHLAGALGFYTGEGQVAVAWVAMMMGFMAADVLLGAIGTEMFPTLQRATASGLRMLALAGGGALGLALESAFHQAGAGHGPSILRVLPAAALAAGAVALFLPETAGKELEDIDSRQPQQETRQ